MTTRTAATTQLQNVTPSQVAKVYTGKAGRCCCGCAGRYFYAADQAAEAEQRGGTVNPAQVTRVLRLLQAETATEVEDGLSEVLLSCTVGSRLYVAFLRQEEV